jgi:hypothetical protein
MRSVSGSGVPNEECYLPNLVEGAFCELCRDLGKGILSLPTLTSYGS